MGPDDDEYDSLTEECSECDGTGEAEDGEDCPYCDGVGYF